jgi:hypothetical protein
MRTGGGDHGHRVAPAAVPAPPPQIQSPAHRLTSPSDLASPPPDQDRTQSNHDREEPRQNGGTVPAVVGDSHLHGPELHQARHHQHRYRHSQRQRSPGRSQRRSKSTHPRRVRPHQHNGSPRHDCLPANNGRTPPITDHSRHGDNPIHSSTPQATGNLARDLPVRGRATSGSTSGPPISCSGTNSRRTLRPGRCHAHVPHTSSYAIATPRARPTTSQPSKSATPHYAASGKPSTYDDNLFLDFFFAFFFRGFSCSPGNRRSNASRSRSSPLAIRWP